MPLVLKNMISEKRELAKYDMYYELEKYITINSTK